MLTFFVNLPMRASSSPINIHEPQTFNLCLSPNQVGLPGKPNITQLIFMSQACTNLCLLLQKEQVNKKKAKSNFCHI